MEEGERARAEGEEGRRVWKVMYAPMGWRDQRIGRQTDRDRQTDRQTQTET